MQHVLMLHYWTLWPSPGLPVAPGLSAVSRHKSVYNIVETELYRLLVFEMFVTAHTTVRQG